jgi:hypothetical protein
MLHARQCLEWSSADSALRVSSSETQAPCRTRHTAPRHGQGRQALPDLFSSHSIRATVHFAEPRTKSASFGEAVFRHTQGSDKTLSRSSEVYMCGCTPIRSQSVDVPNRERRLRNWISHTGGSARSRTSSPQMALNNPRASSGHKEASSRTLVSR